MQNVSNGDKAAQGSGDHSDKSKRLPYREIIGGIVLIVVVVGALAGYYAFNYITKDSERMRFWVGFMFSFAALLVIAIQSVIYVKQAEFMRRQSETMQRQVEASENMVAQNERMSKAAESSAKAAEESAQFAHRSYELTSAPSVTVKEVIVENFAVGKRPAVKIVFTAGGSTTAHRVHIYSRMTVTNTLPFIPDYDAIPEQGGSEVTIAPGQDVFSWVYASWELTQEWSDRIAAGDLRIYLIGKVSYENRLGDVFPRYDYCFRYDRRNGEFTYYNEGMEDG